MNGKYILAFDQGTTSSRSVLFDANMNPLRISQVAIRQIYPQPGWVEHDAMEIWRTQLRTAKEVVSLEGIHPREICVIGIANQRETTVVWNRETGIPVCNAIVWQDRRTAEICEALREKGMESHIRERTGLPIDSYFSATKLSWILKNVSGANVRAESGKLLFGTIDTWLIWNFTGGKVHATDFSNASRTMMFDIVRGCWDKDILSSLEIPENLLPDVRDSDGNFGFTSGEYFDSVSIPIRGVAGDQQAALFGQGCLSPGKTKNTYGTGCFLLMNTGSDVFHSKSGLLSTIGWRLGGKMTYALEGSIFVAGAVIQWLRDEMKLIGSSSESESLATSVPDTGGAYLVPAFAGLGAPHWDMYARGIIAGLSRGTGKAQIVRAALESIAFQTFDIVRAMENDTGIHIEELLVDGGATENNFLMQFQSDILGVPVFRPGNTEATARGGAALAGLSIGATVKAPDGKAGRRFMPVMKEEQRQTLHAGWKKAVKRAGSWVEN